MVWSVEGGFLFLNNKRALDPTTSKRLPKVSSVKETKSEYLVYFKGYNSRKFDKKQYSGDKKLLEDLKKVPVKNTKENKSSKRGKFLIPNVTALPTDSETVDEVGKEKLIGEFEVDVSDLCEAPDQYEVRKLREEWVLDLKRKLREGHTILNGTTLPVLIDPTKCSSREEFDQDSSQLRESNLYLLGGNHLVTALKQLHSEGINVTRPSFSRTDRRTADEGLVIMSLHNYGHDVKEALPKIVKLLANQDVVVKKSLYNILSTYASSDPDMILLATNTLVQECSDSNPMVRGMAIRTLCSLNHETFLEYGIRGVVQGLKDSSAYVRRAAVMGCGQLNVRSHGLCQDHGLVDQLYRCIRDSDPVVMVNAIVVLEEILKKEGGIVVNKNIAHFVLGKIETMTPWGVSYCLQILRKYHPKSEDEMFDILNILDLYLTHNNISVAVSCFELFLHFVSEHPTLKSEVTARCFDHILNVMSNENVEIVYCLLNVLEKYMTQCDIQKHFKAFFCKPKDPIYLKTKKINFLQHVLTENNAGEVLDHLNSLVKDLDKDISLQALKVILFIHQSFKSLSENVESVFLRLLKSDIEHLTSNCLVVMQEMDLNKSRNPSEFLAVLCETSEVIKDEEGRCALLTILSNYGNAFEDAPYVLEDMIDDLEGCSSKVKLHILYACVKMFFMYPSECQHLLGQVFDVCSKCDDECVRNQSNYYYNLMETNIEDAKHVIINCR